MCEIVKGQRRAFRDQDPPRICNKSNENVKSELEFCESTATSPTILQRASSFERCFNESKHLEKGKQNQKKEKVNSIKQESTWSDSIKDSKDSAKVSNELPAASNQTNSENLIKELSDKVPSNSHHDDEVRLRHLFILLKESLCTVMRFDALNVFSHVYARLMMPYNRAICKKPCIIY